MSLIADRLEVRDGNANGDGADVARVGVAAGGGPILDLLVFLPKLESNN